MTQGSPPSGGRQRIVLLQTLAGAAGRIKQAVDGIPADQLDWQPDTETWSVHMTLAHLCHAEPLFRQRFRRMMKEDNPTVPRFGPDSALPHRDLPFAEVLRAFESERQVTLTLLTELQPEDWQRPAVHETLGPTTILKQVQNMIDHDTAHLGQIYDLCQRWSLAHTKEAF